MHRAHWGAKSRANSPILANPVPREHENTRTRLEFSSLTALDTALGPRAPDQLCVIVNLHQHRTFLVLNSPVSRSCRVLPPGMLKSSKLSKTASEASDALETAEAAPASCGASSPNACPRLPAPGLPSGAARGRPSTLAERLRHVNMRLRQKVLGCTPKKAAARPANPGPPSPGVYPRCPPPQLASAGALPRHRRLASPPRAKHQREGALGRQKTGVPAGAEPANPGAPSPGVYPRCPPPQLASAGALPRSAASDALPPDHCPLGVGPVTTRVRVSKLLKLAIAGSETCSGHVIPLDCC